MKNYRKPTAQSDPQAAESSMSLVQASAELGSNDQRVSDANLDNKEEKGGWLSNAWNSLKNFGKETGNAAKHGAVIGAGLSAPLMAVGAAAGGAVGGAAGMAGGVEHGKKGATTGAKVGAGIMALPGALLGAMGGMVTRGVDELRTDEDQLLKDTADIPSYHIIMEQLAHNFAYGRGDLSTLEAWGYEVEDEHEDKNSGLRVVGFSPIDQATLDPDGKPLQPVVAFRGTANLGGALDDANTTGIGTFQFSRNEKQIEGVLNKTGPGADVTGHSLGGALAQLAAARFGGLVGNIVTFQSPGISSSEQDKIDEKEHKATHYRAGGDLVSDAGEAFAKGEVFTFDHKGPNSPLAHLSFPLAELNDLRSKHNMDKPIVQDARSNDDEWVREGTFNEGHWADEEVQTKSRLMDVDHAQDSTETSTTLLTRVAGVVAGGGRQLAEGTRQFVGGLGIADRQSNYAQAWGDIKEVAQAVQSASDVKSARNQIVDMLIKLEVEPKDHGRFVAQAEAAMVDALEVSPLNVGASAVMG